MFAPSQCHSAPTSARNSSLGHPSMAEASLGKNFPKVILLLLHDFSGWYLQGLVKWCVYLSRPRNVWCKLRHVARRGGDISSRDARISTSGCPNLPCLNKLGCPKLRKDARIWVKMPESRLTIRCRDCWLNNSIVLFLMVKKIIYAVNPMHSDIVNWMIIFKVFNLSWHVSYTGVIFPFSQILWFLIKSAWGHTDSYKLRCVDCMLIIIYMICLFVRSMLGFPGLKMTLESL